MNLKKAQKLKNKAKQKFKKNLFDGLAQTEAVFYKGQSSGSNMVGIMTGQAGRQQEKALSTFSVKGFFVNGNEKEIDRGVEGGVNEKEAYLLFFRDDVKAAGLVDAADKLLIRNDKPNEYVLVDGEQYRIFQVRNAAPLADEDLLVQVFIVPRIVNRDGREN